MCCWMSEGQKSQSQFHTAPFFGQVKCEAAGRANSMLGCTKWSTARSWREAMTALSSDTGITWGREFSSRQSQQSQALHSAAWQEDEMGKQKWFHLGTRKTVFTQRIKNIRDLETWCHLWRHVDPAEKSPGEPGVTPVLILLWVLHELQASFQASTYGLYQFHNRSHVQPKAKQAILIWWTDKLILIVLSE